MVEMNSVSIVVGNICFVVIDSSNQVPFSQKNLGVPSFCNKVKGKAVTIHKPLLFQGLPQKYCGDVNTRKIQYLNGGKLFEHVLFQVRLIVHLKTSQVNA